MNDTTRITDLTAASIAMLKKLVAFDSTSRLSNIPIIDFIAETIEKHGGVCTRLPTKDGKKSNLLARIGPDVAGGVILSGHTDVVPTDGQHWDTEPYVLTEHGDKLYGRGASDMKGFLAVCLALLPDFSMLKLQKPIWLAFSYDEEVGCLGAPHLLKHIVKSVPKPAFAIIGEPTLMQVVTAHKGVLSFETTVSGLEGHSSQPQLGVNAVHYACSLVNYLSDMVAEATAAGLKDARFDPPCSTVHVGTIEGGTARNIIPRQCKFSWEIRPLPGDDADALVLRFESRCKELRKEMKKIFADADIVTRPNSRMMGGTLPADAQHYAALVMRCAKTNEERAVSFGTEAGVFNEHGVPAIVCGPGSIEQAHKPNEFVEISQVSECVAFLLRLADEVSGDR